MGTPLDALGGIAGSLGGLAGGLGGLGGESGGAASAAARLSQSITYGDVFTGGARSKPTPYWVWLVAGGAVLIVVAAFIMRK